ncbi:hypothetical protein BT67DRAFT_137475 [Trichocladium antarcticum]|uniref:Uncharacterized protein n=1 Tax=Trichocladium antarcticum TaxID=1450529 RepID=A0AAN6UFD5_9PEZI|nr:hypothetical protein BT67DRAFT_137475 [Trichocladium antarcticum]
MPRPTTPNLGWVRPEPPAVAYRSTLPNPRFGSFQQIPMDSSLLRRISPTSAMFRHSQIGTGNTMAYLPSS